LENLLGWAEDEEIAILGITETNLTEREGRFLTLAANRKYVGYWTNAAEDKKKGSGLGILIEEQWEKHVGAVKKISEYMIEITLYFKQLELVVIGVYIPPNNKTLEKSIQQKIVETVTRRKRRTQVVIMGDFNHTANNILDRQQLQSASFKRLPIFNWMKKQNFTDTYRDMHPTSQEYTWSNKEAATRIDYIWVSEELASGLQRANIKETEGITESDHKIVTAEIWIKCMIGKNSKAEVKRKGQARTVYLYDQAKVEDWENYAQELQKRLEIKESLKNIQKKEQDEEKFQSQINSIWDTIEEAIITAANKHIPKKRIYNTTVNRRTSQKEQQQEKDIVNIQRLLKYAKKRKNQEVTEEERSKTNEQVKELGKKLGAKLPKLQRQWSNAWIEDMKGWQKLLQEKKRKEWEQAQRRQIEENIDKRCEMIKTDQGKMIASLLNRPYKKIILDRLIKQVGEETHLVTKPEEVKADVAEHYKMQFRKRNTKLEIMTEKWEEMYKPRKNIKEDWYAEVEERIKEKE
jgi:exonuclease III